MSTLDASATPPQSLRHSHHHHHLFTTEMEPFKSTNTVDVELFPLLACFCFLFLYLSDAYDHWSAEEEAAAQVQLNTLSNCPDD